MKTELLEDYLRSELEDLSIKLVSFSQQDEEIYIEYTYVEPVNKIRVTWSRRISILTLVSWIYSQI